MLKRILYVSDSLIGAESADMLGLARQAVANNARMGITGFLYHDRDSFAQIIEGLESDVVPLYDRIRHDPRHRNLRTLRDEPISTRLFGDWSMGLLDGEAGDGIGRQAFGEAFPKAITQGDAPRLIAFLRDLGVGRVRVLASTARDG